MDQHLNRPTESRPRTTVGRVHVNSRIDIRPHLVQARVNHESSPVGSMGGLFLDLALFVDKHKVRDLDETEVFCVWIYSNNCQLFPELYFTAHDVLARNYAH